MTPNGYRFIGIAPEVDLTERRSKLINDQTEPFTLDEIRGYKVFTALLTQSGGDAPIQVGSGNIIEGVRYSFVEYEVEGWDFTNVGGPKYPAANSFTATVTAAPILWGGVTLEYNTGAPVATVLENTLGFNPYFTFAADGVYYSNNPEWFEFKAREASVQVFINCGGYIDGYIYSAKANFTYEEGILVITSFNEGTLANDVLSDSDNFFKTSIEIRVYN